MATKKCFNTMTAIKKSLSIMRPDKTKLIDNDLFIHNRVSDNDLTAFISKSINTSLSRNLKPYEVILMNDKNVCFHLDNKFYLLPANIKGLTMNGRTIEIAYDYPFVSDLSKFKKLE